MEYEELYDLVCKKIYKITKQSEDATQALYNYVLSLDDTDLWTPRDNIQEREKKWMQLVGSNFNPYNINHREQICHMITRRVAKNIETKRNNSNNNNNNNSLDYNDLPEEIIEQIVKTIAISDVKVLTKLAKVNKTWSRIAKGIEYSILNYAVNFFTNLLYYKPLKNNIAIFLSTKLKKLIDSEGLSSFATDQKKHDYVSPLIYILNGNIVYNDNIKKSRNFVKYIQKSIGFELLKYYDGSDSGHHGSAFSARITRIYGNIKIPLLVTKHQIYHDEPKLSTDEAVFMVNPKSIVEVLVNFDDNLQFAIDSVSSLYEDGELYMKKRKDLGLMGGAWTKNGGPSSRDYLHRSSIFTDNFPLELIEAHDIAMTRTDDDYLIKYPFFVVGISKVAEYIQKNLNKIQGNPWFTQNAVDNLLSGTANLEEGQPTKFRVADEKFLEEFLEDCHSRNNSYAEDEWRTPS